MELGELFAIFIGVIFVNNFVLSRFLGLCPYVGVTRESSSALGMGMAVIFVMTLASAVTWMVDHYLLQPTASNLCYRVARVLGASADPGSFDLRYLDTIAFILVIAALVQFVEMVIQKASPGLYLSLGIYLPLITTNCAVLGVAQLNVGDFAGMPMSFLKSIVQGFGAGIGFTLAMLLMAGIRERLDLADVPEPLKGIPITFIAAGLMSIAFLGFQGLQI